MYYVNYKQYLYEIHSQHQKLKNKFIIYSYKIHNQQKEIRYNDTLHMCKITHLINEIKVCIVCLFPSSLIG